jgi:uncharacterized Zn-binding protein involved in type VI secretion
VDVCTLVMQVSAPSCWEGAGPQVGGTAEVMVAVAPAAEEGDNQLCPRRTAVERPSPGRHDGRWEKPCNEQRR